MTALDRCLEYLRRCVGAAARAVLVGHRGLCAAALAAALAMAPLAHAQEEPGEMMDDSFDGGEAVDAAKEILARKLPDGATREQEISFLLDRERAAFAVGASRLRLEALRRLVELTAGTPQVNFYRGALWREEWRSGNSQRAFEMGEQLVASSEVPLAARAEYASELTTDYLYLGERLRARQTLARADRLVAEYQRGPQPRMADRVVAVTELARAGVLGSEGRHGEAEIAIRKAQSSIDRAVEASRNAPRAEGRVSLYDSNLRFRLAINGRFVSVLTAMGRHVEAESIARAGLQAAASEETRGATIGYWNVRIGQAKLAQGRYVEAQDFIERGLATYAQAGLLESSVRTLNAGMLRLHALLGQERWVDADAAYNAMLRATADDAAGRQRISSPLLRAILHALNDRGGEALKEIDSSVRYRARLYGEKNAATQEAKAVRAMVLQRNGSAGQALSAYREVFDVLFSEDVAYSDVASTGMRGLYLPLAFDAFLTLVASESAAGRANPDLVAQAFMVTDRLRSGRVQQAIIDSAARSVVASDAELSKLVRAEQDLRSARRDAFIAINQHFAEIRDAERELKAIREAGKDKDPAQLKLEVRKAQATRAALLKTVEDLRKQVSADETEQRSLRKVLASRFPAYSRLVNPAPVRPTDIARRLVSGEVLVSTYSTDAQTFVWAIPANGDARMHVATVGAKAIATDVSRLRLSLQLGGRTTPPPFNFVSANRLYATLLQPLANTLSGAKSLTVVTSEALGQIPFSLLVKEPAKADSYDTAAWLVKDLAITHVASASAWLAVREAAGKAIAAKPFVGFGDPQFSSTVSGATGKAVRETVTQAVIEQGARYDYGAMPPLPETRTEITAMAKSLNADASSTFFGPAATRGKVLSMDLRDFRVVAFATHGLKAGDLPDLSQPALAMAATTSGESPLLTLDDVLKLRLGAEWVVLSACNTAASDGSSDEAISGLGRGFFFSGARSMLVTHWAVETTSAQSLVTGIFQHYAGRTGLTRAESLRQAQLEMISGKAGESFRHPFYWAPYALVGDAAR